MLPGFPGVEGFDAGGRTTDLRVAVDLVETADRTDVADAVRFATGLGFGTSAGGRLLTEDVVLDATDGGRLGVRGVDVPVVRTLTVETDDAAEPRRVRPTLLGVSSDRAVSNAVEFHCWTRWRPSTPVVMQLLTRTVTQQTTVGGAWTGRRRFCGLSRSSSAWT